MAVILSISKFIIGLSLFAIMAVGIYYIANRIYLHFKLKRKLKSIRKDGKR